MIRRLSRLLPAAVMARLKVAYLSRKHQFVRRFLAYGPAELRACFVALGICEGDTVMLHSAFGPSSGFRGSPKELIDVLLGVIGRDGNLLMVSLPYRTSTLEYLEQGKLFDVRKTSSRMGLISETFRRKPGVRRSLHPTHSVLAYGPKADWIVADHERCTYACGPGSPFEKLSLLDGKLVFFNVPPTAMTFFHYLEHLVQSKIDFPLYLDRTFDVPVVDWNGAERTVGARVFSAEAVRRRRPLMLWGLLEKKSRVRKATVGNTRLLAAEAKHLIDCTRDMVSTGATFYTPSYSAALRALRTHAPRSAPRRARSEAREPTVAPRPAGDT